MKRYGGNNINNIENLEELFDLWKNKQKKDKRNTGVFVSDGYIFEDKYKKSKKRILFILKESHLFDGEKEHSNNKIITNNQSEFYKDFFRENYKDKYGNKLYEIDENNIICPKAWITRNEKELIENPKQKEKICRAFDNRPKQKEKISRISEYILHKNISSDYNILKEALAQISFMNINKMGGGVKTNPKELYGYYIDYKEFIIREIEILNPSIIVFMAHDYEIIKDLKETFSTIKIINMIHTAAIGRNLTLENYEKNYYKKCDCINDGEGPFIKFNETTKRFLAKFIYRYENI